MKNDTNLVLSAEQVKQKIQRLAHEIWENYYTVSEIHLVGIQGQGLTFAEQVRNNLSSIAPIPITLSAIEINKSNPQQRQSKLHPADRDFSGKHVILFDDVLNSGKTLIYAAKALLAFDLASLHTCILVNRRHHKFPIRADFVGLTLNTTLQEHINVKIEGDQLSVYLE